MSDETASSNTPSESSAEEHESLLTRPIPHRENPDAEVEVRKLKVKRKKNGSTFVEVTTNAHMKFSITDLSELPSYQEFFSNADGFANSATPAMKYDFAFIFEEMRNRRISISGGFDCAGRLLNIPSPRAYLRASEGFLFYCLEDVDTYGTVGSATGVIMPAIQAHIELPRADNEGRTVNDLKLHKDTLYLLRGHEQYTPRPRVKRRRILRQVYICESPRTYLDHGSSSRCDLYCYFPSVFYTGTRSKVKYGPSCILQTAPSNTLLVCGRQMASEDLFCYVSFYYTYSDCKARDTVSKKEPPITTMLFCDIPPSDCQNLQPMRVLLHTCERPSIFEVRVLYVKRSARINSFGPFLS